MVFSLCSSAGVHGVFVRDFFGGGGAELSPSAGAGAFVAFVVLVVVGGGPEARRFLPLVGEGGTTKVGVTSATDASAELGGWIWSVCAVDEASKGSMAGFMLRLVIGAVELQRGHCSAHS